MEIFQLPPPRLFQLPANYAVGNGQFSSKHTNAIIH